MGNLLKLLYVLLAASWWFSFLVFYTMAVLVRLFWEAVLPQLVSSLIGWGIQKTLNCTFRWLQCLDVAARRILVSRREDSDQNVQANPRISQRNQDIQSFDLPSRAASRNTNSSQGPRNSNEGSNSNLSESTSGSLQNPRPTEVSSSDNPFPEVQNSSQETAAHAPTPEFRFRLRLSMSLVLGLTPEQGGTGQLGSVSPSHSTLSFVESLRRDHLLRDFRFTASRAESTFHRSPSSTNFFMGFASLTHHTAAGLRPSSVGSRAPFSATALRSAAPLISSTTAAVDGWNHGAQT